MRRKTLLCLKSLGACFIIWAAGCGTHQPPVLSGPDSIPAPRKFELPPYIRPLLTVEQQTNDEADSGPVLAQYQQPQPPPSSRPRITGVSTSTAPSSSSSSIMPRGDFPPFDAPRPTVNQPPTNLPTATVPNTGAPAANQPDEPSSAASVPQSPTPTMSSPPQSIYGRDFHAPGGYSNSIPSPPPQQSTFQPRVEPEFVAARQATVPQFQPSAPAPQQPTPPQQQSIAAMNAVAEQALQRANLAGTMAQRGMLFAANTELVKGLTLISQSLDVQQGTAVHSTALTTGLTALQEAHDFASTGNHKGGATDIAAIAATHQTKLPNPIAPSASPVVAQQLYFGFAQQQLAIAGGGLKASSDILNRLGRLQTVMAAHDNDPDSLHGPQAIVFHQAALATDANNWLAANELGVLYARYGQLPQARQLLVQSVMIHPHRQGWQNLAVIHRRLGETDLAQRAENEVQLLAKQPGQAESGNELVRWVDPKTFSATGGGEANWPVTVAAKTTTGGTARR